MTVQFLGPDKYAVMREMDKAESDAMDQAMLDQNYPKMSEISHSLISIMNKEEAEKVAGYKFPF